MVQKAKV